MKYVVMSSTARMPSSCKYGPYGRVAVVALDFDSTAITLDRSKIPRMISAHARGVESIVAVWERVWVGRNVRSAYTKAVAKAKEMAAKLNGCQPGDVPKFLNW